MKEFYQKIMHQFFRDITALGGFLFFTLVSFLILAFGEITLFLRMVFGLFFTLLVVVLIREIYFKKRPRPQEYTNKVEKIDASSFPSLHTARITFLALSFSFFFRQPKFSVFFAFVAVLVAGSRIYLKKHDWWDLLGGAVLGVITFWLSSLL